MRPAGRPAPRNRINRQIRVPNVRVLGPDGEQIGVMPTHEALRRAEEMGFDLVEVAPMAQPPVCRIIEYGKLRYEEQQREKEARKRQKVISTKEVQVKPGCSEHDLQVKMRNAERFIAEGNRLRVVLRFRGRQIVHPELGRQVLDRFIARLAETAIVEQQPLLEGKQLGMTFAPRPQKGGQAAKSAPVATSAAA